MDKPVKVVIIGTGARAIAFCKFIADEPKMVKLIAVVDVNMRKAQVLIDRFNLVADVSDDVEKTIRRDDIDAVMISTPDYAHVLPAILALQMNKHLYIEKPLATTLEACDAIIEAARNSKAICYLGFNMRHIVLYEKIHSFVQEGMLGKITTIEANEWYYGGKSYFRRWNRFRKYSGGLWLTKACHDFDIINWIAGGRPISVYAVCNLSCYKLIPGAGPRCRDCAIRQTCPDFYDINKPLDNWFDEIWRQLQLTMEQDGSAAPDICLFNSEKDTFDNGMALIEYDNDVRASYTVNVVASRNTRQIRVNGTEGMVEGDIEEGWLRVVQRHTGKVSEYDLDNDIKGTHFGADEKIFTDFFKICNNGGQPRSGLLNGRVAVQISVAAQESCDKAMRISL
jgi:predicted dehydrogenase